jgi:hypothetical protein
VREGLDIFLVDESGYMESGRFAHMENSFASITIAELLHTPDFQVLPRIWRYDDVTLGPEDIADLRIELQLLREKYRVTPLADAEVTDEFDELEHLLNDAIDRQIGIRALGP